MGRGQGDKAIDLRMFTGKLKRFLTRIYSGFYFYYHTKYHILNMLKIKCDINQQDLKRVDLHVVKSE